MRGVDGVEIARRENANAVSGDPHWTICHNNLSMLESRRK